MLTLHFKDQKLKIKRKNLLCSWSKEICRQSEGAGAGAGDQINLKRYEINDFKNVLRIMKLLEDSESLIDFRRNLEILSSVLEPMEIRNTLKLIHEIKIVPPQLQSSQFEIPVGGTLANFLAPIMVNVDNKKRDLSMNEFQKRGGGRGEQETDHMSLKTLIYCLKNNGMPD